MKAVVFVGVVLILTGVFALAYDGLTYGRQAQAGTVEMRTDEPNAERVVPLPTVLGGLSLAGGALLVIVGSRQSNRR